MRTKKNLTVKEITNLEKMQKEIDSIMKKFNINNFENNENVYFCQLETISASIEEIIENYYK